VLPQVADVPVVEFIDKQSRDETLFAVVFFLIPRQLVLSHSRRVGQSQAGVFAQIHSRIASSLSGGRKMGRRHVCD
jgi:hypothetical protein